MNKKMHIKSAGVAISLSLFSLLFVFYALLGTVNLVFVKNGEVLCAQENVSALTMIDDPLVNMDAETYEENKETVFVYYDVLNRQCVFGENMFDFRVHIAIMVLNNFIEFRWTEASNTIVLYAYE